MSTNAPRKIIHVDDDAQFSRIAKTKLESAGIEVRSIHDPKQVLGELLESDYQVVVLDFDMPGMDGMELLRQIKQQDGGIQVIMLTGMVTMSTVLQAMRWGAEACVFKPFDDARALLTALEAAFDKIDRWWQSLQDLKERKLAENAALTTATTDLHLHKA